MKYRIANPSQPLGDTIVKGVRSVTVDGQQALLYGKGDTLVAVVQMQPGTVIDRA